MHEITIKPRFCETDARGHINNTVLPVWFEQGRTEVFLDNNPPHGMPYWPVMIARIEIDYLEQTFYRPETTVRSGVEKINTRSFIFYQQIWQGDKMVARARSVMVYLDMQTQRSTPIPEDVRPALAALLVSPDAIL